MKNIFQKDKNEITDLAIPAHHTPVLLKKYPSLTNVTAIYSISSPLFRQSRKEGSLCFFGNSFIFSFSLTISRIAVKIYYICIGVKKIVG